MNFLRRVFANGLDADLIRLFRMLLPYKGLIALACIFLIGAASMSSLTATLLGKLTDLGFYQEEKWVIFAAPAALIGVSLLFAVSTVMSSILMAKVSQSVLVTLRTELFERMLHWPAEAYQKFSTGTVSSKFVNEANIALSGATNSIIVLVRDIVQVIALLAVLFWHNWQLTLVAFVVAPGLALILRAISRRMRMIVKRSQEALAAMISRVQESYGAARIVKVAGTYDYEDERFAQINGRIRSLAESFNAAHADAHDGSDRVCCRRCTFSSSAGTVDFRRIHHIPRSLAFAENADTSAFRIKRHVCLHVGGGKEHLRDARYGARDG